MLQQLHLTPVINSEKSDKGTVVPIILNGQNNNVFSAQPRTPDRVPYILLKTLKHQQNSPTMSFKKIPTVIMRKVKQTEDELRN